MNVHEWPEKWIITMCRLRLCHTFNVHSCNIFNFCNWPFILSYSVVVLNWYERKKFYNVKPILKVIHASSPSPFPKFKECRTHRQLFPTFRFFCESVKLVFNLIIVIHRITCLLYRVRFSDDTSSWIFIESIYWSLLMLAAMQTFPIALHDNRSITAYKVYISGQYTRTFISWNHYYANIQKLLTTKCALTL